MATMKKLIVVLALALSGCAFIFPKPHDPVMFGYMVDVKVGLSKVSCDAKQDWKPVMDKIETVKVYSTLRDDPQAPALKSLQDAVTKAYDSKSTTFCESVLKLNRTRVDVAIDAWKGRK
jgi:hypothetical protein